MEAVVSLFRGGESLDLNSFFLLECGLATERCLDKMRAR